jgi:hypothetical protein
MGSWIVFAVQVALSLITLALVVLSFVWLRSTAREGREAKRLLENMSALVHKVVGMPSPGQRPAVTEVERVRPTVETPPPLAVKVGTEVVELDAETIARIDALREDVNAGRTDGRLLQLLIDAGLDKAEQGDRVSGEVPRAPEDRGAEEASQDKRSDEERPILPKKPTGR